MVETGIQPSFIPHDAGKPTVQRRRSSGGLSELLLLLGIIAAVAAVALSAGVFLYQQFLQSQGASAQQQIQRAESDFQPASIQEITRLNDRLEAAQQILSSHIAPSLFFDALNSATLQTVSFSSLTFGSAGSAGSSGTTGSGIAIKMDGVAQSMNSIALESEVLGQSGVFSNPIFSGIDRQADGVHFEVDATVDPTSISYEKYVQAEAAGGASTTTPTVIPSSSASSSPSASTSPAQ